MRSPTEHGSICRLTRPMRDERQRSQPTGDNPEWHLGRGSFGRQQDAPRGLHYALLLIIVSHRLGRIVYFEKARFGSARRRNPSLCYHHHVILSSFYYSAFKRSTSTSGQGCK